MKRSDKRDGERKHDTQDQPDINTIISKPVMDKPCTIFFRALYSFCSSEPIPAANGGSAYTAPISAGDVVIVHAVQGNGWVYATVLPLRGNIRTPLEGWVPGNHCIRYDDTKVGVLLEAFVEFMQVMYDVDNDSDARGKGDATENFVTNHNDNNGTTDGAIRKIVNGVQRLLRKTGCLEKDAVARLHAGTEDARHDPIVRARRNLLGNLSILVKRARREDVRKKSAAEESSRGEESLLQNAAKVVVSGVIFLDAWTQRVEGRTFGWYRSRKGKGNLQGQTTQGESSNCPTPVDVYVDEHDHDHAHGNMNGNGNGNGDEDGSVQVHDAARIAVPGSSGSVVPAGGGSIASTATPVISTMSLMQDANFPKPVDACTRGSGFQCQRLETVLSDIADDDDEKFVGEDAETKTPTEERNEPIVAGEKSNRDSLSKTNNFNRQAVVQSPVVDSTLQSISDPTSYLDRESISKLKITNIVQEEKEKKGIVVYFGVCGETAKAQAAGAKLCAWGTNNAPLRGLGQATHSTRHFTPLAAFSSATFSQKQDCFVSTTRLSRHNIIIHSPTLATATTISAYRHRRAYSLELRMRPSLSLQLPTLTASTPSLVTSISTSTSTSTSATATVFVSPSPASSVSTASSPTTTIDFHSLSGPGLENDAPVLASIGLQLAHDSLISSLGALVGSHLQHRHSKHFQHLKTQSLDSGHKFLDIVIQISSRGHHPAPALDEAKLDMANQLRQLDQVSNDLSTTSFGSTKPNSPRQPLLDRTNATVNHNDSFINKATRCVRSANDCFDETIAIIERIGDFDLGPLDLRISGSFSRALSDENLYVRKRPRLDTLPRFEELSLEPSPVLEDLPASLKIRLPESQPQSTRPSPKPCSTTSPILASPTSFTSSDTLVSQTMLYSPPLPLLSHSPVIDVPILNTDTADFWQSRRCQSSPPAKRRRSASFGTSLADSAGTRISSLEHSDQSFYSAASTTNTSPDPSPTRDFYQRPLHDSFGPFSDSKLTLFEEDRGVEKHSTAVSYAHELILGTDGHVRGGTLRALVEKLTPYESTPDPMFLNTFYTTFRLFTTPVACAEALVHRYDYVAQNKEGALPVRLRVYNFFKGWLETYWRVETDNEALIIIQRFALGPVKFDIPSVSKRLLELIDRVGDVKHRPMLPRLVSTMGKINTSVGNGRPSTEPLPQPLTTKHQLSLLRNSKQGGAKCSILDFDPLELARQITLMKSDIYCQIEPEELLAQEWRKGSTSRSRNVKAMCVATTDLANLVIDTILSSEEPRKRATMIKQWVKVAKHARELSNYDTLKAILIALESSPIHRLRKTWELVSPRTTARLEELRPIIDSSRNWATLRGIMRNHPVPCVPSLSNYLTDLAFIDEGNTVERLWKSQSYISPLLANSSSAPGTLKVVNFEKYLLTARSIGEIQRFQVQYRLSPVAEMQQWLEGEFKRVKMLMTAGSAASSITGSGGAWTDGDGAFWKRSLRLEPREQGRDSSMGLGRAMVGVGLGLAGGGGGKPSAAGGESGVQRGVSFGPVNGNGNGGGAASASAGGSGSGSGRGKDSFWNNLHLPMTLR